MWFSFFELKYTHFAAHPHLNYRARFHAAREMRDCIRFAVAFGLVLSNESLADKFTGYGERRRGGFGGWFSHVFEATKACFCTRQNNLQQTFPG